MKKFGLSFGLAVLTVGVLIAAEIEERTIQGSHEGMSVSVPKEWPGIEAHRTPAGKPYYQLGPGNTNFSIQIYLSGSVQGGTNVVSGLERSLEASLKPLIGNSVEGWVEFVRFGKEKEGVYARLTDRAPKPGEYLFYTRGVRLIGTNVLGFELVSNDKDFSALSNTLAVIESVKIAGSR
jgi:hypothetical protein